MPEVPLVEPWAPAVTAETASSRPTAHNVVPLMIAPFGIEGIAAVTGRQEKKTSVYSPVGIYGDP